MGIEPIALGVSPEPDGFEGRAGHQTRIASLAKTMIVPALDRKLANAFRFDIDRADTVWAQGGRCSPASR